MGKFIITVLAALFVSQPCFGQVDLGASKLTIDAFERGRRLKADEANSQAQRELARAQAELLKAQTEALRQPQVPQVEPVYTEQEVKAGLLQLTQRHPDWREYEQRMANEALVPVKGLSAYDYVLALYLLAKEKTAEEQQAAAQGKMLTDLLQQRLSRLPPRDLSTHRPRQYFLDLHCPVQDRLRI